MSESERDSERDSERERERERRREGERERERDTQPSSPNHNLTLCKTLDLKSPIAYFIPASIAEIMSRDECCTWETQSKIPA